MIKRKRESSYSEFDSYSNSELSEGKVISRSLIYPKGLFKDDFLMLSKHYPFLKKHMILNLRWKPLMPKSSMYHFDFNYPDAVYHLSKSILKHNYNLNFYLPCGCEEEESCNFDKELELYNQYFKDSYWITGCIRYLAPCIPNRLSYIKSISSLLCVEANNSESIEIRNDTFSPDKVLKGKHIVVMDVGTGASCIYSLLGVAENSWSFIATDIDDLTMELAKKNIDLNHFGDFIKLRLQEVPTLMFNNVLYSQELIALTVCNPPFHSSIDKTGLNPRTSPTGTEHELVFSLPENSTQIIEQSYMNYSKTHDIPSVMGHIQYTISDPDHGELAFIEIMIQESKFYCNNVLWFTSLVAKLSTLKKLKSIIQKEMRQYQLNHFYQEQFLSRKLDKLYFENSSFKFGFTPEDKIEISQIHCCEFRTFTLKLGKQTRWIIAWTYYNSIQRLKIINNLANLSTQQSNI